MWTESVVSVAPMATSAIMTNNLTVSFITFAGGITFGLLTLFSLFNNGMELGVIGAACHHYGMSLALWSFVAAHGSLELPSIIIAGAAGLRLGHAMLFPSGYRWKDSVAQWRHRGHPPGLRHHPAAHHRRHTRGILLALARAGVAQVRRGRNPVHAAERVAVPAGYHADCRGVNDGLAPAFAGA